MNTWTEKSGYPIVSVVINDNGLLTITQERFLLRNLNNISTDTNTWSVPITYTTESELDFDNTNPKYWLSTKRSTADFDPKLDPTKWIIFNVQSSG